MILATFGRISGLYNLVGLVNPEFLTLFFFFVEGMCYLEYHLCHTLNMILINIYIYRSHSLSLAFSLSRINNFKTTILQIYACVRLCITLQKLLDSCHSRLHNQSSINVTQLYVLHRKKATLFNLVNVFHSVSS